MLSLGTAPPVRCQAQLDVGLTPGYEIDLGYQQTSTTFDVYDPASSTRVHRFFAPPEWIFTNPVAKPLSQGHLLVVIQRQFVRKLVELDWASQVVWEYTPPPTRTIHHDFEPLDNGNVLLLLRELKTLPVFGATLFWDDVVVEVDRQGNVVWDWSTAAHLQELPTPMATWAAVAPHLSNFSYPFHANSVQSLPPNRFAASDPRFTPGNVMIGYRNTNIVAIVDRASRSVVWSLHDVTIGQHHPRMIPAGLRGAGNILIFDNGGYAGVPVLPYRGYSRVVEVDPLTQQIVWQYGSPQLGLFSEFMGSSQRLIDGNTLITEGWRGRVLEVDPRGRIVWQQRGPQVYRSYRMPALWQTSTIAPFRW